MIPKSISHSRMILETLSESRLKRARPEPAYMRSSCVMHLFVRRKAERIQESLLDIAAIFV